MPPAGSAHAPGAVLTQSELTEHRLKMLEQQAEGSRQVERDVDLLKATMARFEALLVEVKTEASSRSDQLHTSLSRLHQRFDDLAKEEHIEQGAKAERQRLGRVMVLCVTAGTAVGGVLVGVASLLIQ
jgi:hypothetical protein